MSFQSPAKPRKRFVWILPLAAAACVLGIIHFTKSKPEATAPTLVPVSPLPESGIDMIAFGEDASEAAHGIRHAHSETIAGGLGKPARRLLAGGPFSWQGGSVEWTMQVDPEKQNYFTVKLWGSDKGMQSGRLILFADGLQVGYRHESDHDLLNQSDDDALAPGRFVYVTVPLPPGLTAMKERITLRIIATGPIWFYGSHFEQYQKNFTGPSRGIYRAYTHTSPRFVPSAMEIQGRMPEAEFRSSPGPEVIDQTRSIVTDRLSRALRNPNLPGNIKGISEELYLLSEAWHVGWTPAHRDRRTLDRLIRLGDTFVEDFHRDAKFVENDWSGARPLGQAIVSAFPDIGADLEQSIKLGGKTQPRKAAWAAVLKHGMDHWRTRRRSYTNQSMIVDAGIYTSNRALGLIDPTSAIDPARALGYLRESAGIDPWLGSDTPDGGSEKPYGANYHLISRKGLSRELGYVASYGETIQPFMFELASHTGDRELREQTRRMQRARLVFRYPSFDADGHRCMKLVSEIDNRTAHYPQSGSAYNASDVREAWWMETASLLPDDPAIVGAAQQSVREGQYFHHVQKRLKDRDTLGMMRNVDAWKKVSALPESKVVLPMTPGQPDFVFADEQVGVLAIKRGEEMLFVNLYYRAERAVNRVARVFELSPQITRIATVRSEVEIIPSGNQYTRPDWIDRIRGRGITPPGQDLHQAWAGEVMPIAKRPDDAKSPAYGEWGPFVGKAAFYVLRYGDYLIGMNTTVKNSYPLQVPQGVESVRDLVSGKAVQADQPLVVPPLATVVLHIPGGPQAAH